MKSFTKVIAASVLCLLFMVSISPSARGGDGTYTEGSPDKLTLNAVFQYNEASFNPNAAWEGAFTRASQLLYNSTDGQVQIGTVNFYNHCPEANNKADLLIHSGSGGAAAHVGGLGTKGLNIDVYNDTHTKNVAAARGQFGIVHEFGHFVFGLYDEYKDKDGNSANCISAASTVASIMDGGTTVPIKNQRTEWSIEAHKVACANTAQYQKRGMTSWPWISKYAKTNYKATLTIPTVYNTTLPSGHQAVTYNYYDCKVRSVVCLDRSGSMAGSKITTAKSGAKVFVDLNRDSDELGVSSYASTATSNYAIKDMTAANKTSAKSAIDALVASGSTNIGGGLQTSLNMITGQGDPVSNEIIVLLSDGQHNTGTDPSSVLPALKARKVKVHTIGLGGDVDAAELSNIAAQTGGSYFYAASTTGLQAHFNTIFAAMRNDGIATKLSEEVAAGGTKTHSTYIDSYTTDGGDATFLITWADGDLDLTLKRPNNSTVGDSDADVDFHVKDSLSELYRMSDPASGSWTMVVTSSSGQAVSYDLQVNSNADSNVMVMVATDQDSYTMNDRVLLTASVRAPKSGGTEGQRVMGASVTAEVVFDDQVVDTLQLYDDGHEHHGDDRLNDGVYSNYFTNYVTDGSYTFNVTVVNQNGTTAPPDEQYPGWIPENVDPFTRWGQETVVVDIGNIYAPLIYKNIPVATQAKGKVTYMGASISGQVLLMRYYNGSSWSTFNTAYTDAGGNYLFPSIPPLGTNQRFYIRWNNSDNGSDNSRLWYWRCDMVDNASASETYTCNFDLENIDLTSPSSGATMSLPAAFYWQQRVLTSDDYEYNLLDTDDDDPWWWTDPSLGYAYRYILNSLPSGFHPGPKYGWFIRVHGANGYGISYYYRSIYFSNYGMQVDGVEEPIDRLLPQVDLDEWLIPPPLPETD